MPTAERFWNRHAAGYAKRPIRDMAAYERTLARTRAYLAPADRVLEVGCGTGSTALLLAPDVGRLVATDVSARMIEIARAKLPPDAPGPSFVRAGVLDELEEEAPFDAVLAFNLLHLVDDLPTALRRLHARLVPGGVLVSKTPCLAGFGAHWWLLIRGMQLLRLAPDVRFLDGAELEWAITAAGFEIVEADDHNTKPQSRFVVARKPGA